MYSCKHIYYIGSFLSIQRMRDGQMGNTILTAYVTHNMLNFSLNKISIIKYTYYIMYIL